MDTEQENNINEGDSAPLTAQETEELEANIDPLLESEFVIQDEDSNAEQEEADDEDGEETSKDDKNETGKESNKTEEKTNKTKPKETENANKKKNRFDNAIRKKIKWFLDLGMPRSEAMEKAVIIAAARGVKLEDLPEIRPKRRKIIEEASGGFKVCIVLDKYPEEHLSPEQLKTIEDTIMDKVLELVPESTIKPKFRSCVHKEGYLSVVCADKETADWLKEITKALQLFEGASLKAVDDDDMPHLENYLAFFPDSADYPDEKILKLVEAQNDSFSVSSWTIAKRESVGTEAQVTFSIDRKHAIELKKAKCKISYKFGHVQLWPKENKDESVDAKDSKNAKDSRPKPSVSDNKNTTRPRRPKPRRNDRFKAPPARSTNWRNASNSQWRRGARDEPLRNRGSRDDRAFDRRPGGNYQYNIEPWGNNGSTGGQGIGSYYGDQWKPWNR